MFSGVLVDCWRAAQHGCCGAAIFPCMAHVQIPRNGVCVWSGLGADAFAAVKFPTVETVGSGVTEICRERRFRKLDGFGRRGVGR